MRISPSYVDRVGVKVTNKWGGGKQENGAEDVAHFSSGLIDVFACNSGRRVRGGARNGDDRRR